MNVIKKEELKLLEEMLRKNIQTLTKISKNMTPYEKSQLISMYTICLQNGMNREEMKRDDNVGIYDYHASKMVYPKTKHKECDWDTLLFNRKEC